MSSVFENIYEGATELGKFRSMLILGIAIICAVLLGVVGTYLFMSNQSNLIDAVATSLQSKCESWSDGKNTRRNCYTDIKYVVNNKEYTASINTGNLQYANGANVEITYDAQNPANVTTKIIRNKWIGIILSIIAIVLIGFGLFNYYMSQRFKLYAAAQGTGTALSLVSAPFRQ